jgi:precorrin-2 dehydrogenase / sirohydrochlorin ferrochelatase
MAGAAQALMVRMAGRRVVCVGAGGVAADKALPLVEAGADVTVIAPEAVPGLRDAAERGLLVWLPRRYAPGDLDLAYLVLAATADPAVNEQVVRDAEAQATWCVRVDAGGPTPGSAAIPAAVRRGALTIAISTAGRAPVLSRALRHELEERYGPEYGELVALLGELRADPALRAHLAGLDGPGRRSAWRAVLRTDILTLIRSGQHSAAREVATACLFSSSA